MNFVFVSVGIGSRAAGGDVIAIEVARRLARAGHGLSVLTSEEGRDIWQASGVAAEYWVFDRQKWRVPSTGSGRGAGGLFAGSLALTRRLLKATAFALGRRADASVVIAASDMLQDVVAGAALRGRGSRRLAIFHMVNPSPFRGYAHAFDGAAPPALDLRAGLNFLQQRLALLWLRRCYDIVITQTPANRRFLEAHLKPSQVLPRDLPYGVDFGEDADSDHLEEPTFDACWLGRYHPQKGLDDLLRVWQLVVRERPWARLALIGDVAQAMAPQIEAMGLAENVACLGYLSGAAKLRALRQSRLFLFPSRFEGKPVAIAEALACGLPVVAYDLPVYEGAFAGGLVRCAIGDVAEMAGQVLRLLDDGEALRALSRAAREAVAGQTWEASAQLVLEAATAAMGSAPTKSGEAVAA